MRVPDLTRLQRPLLALAAFLFLLPGVNPTFYADDSAETVTAAALLGVPHPPGYPLQTLLGRLALGFPLGGPAFRVDLLSAMLAALACLLLFELLTRWVRSPAAWLLSLFWVVGAVSYPGALSAKTGLYQLAAGLLVALVLALAQARVEAAGFLFGLGLACHWMTFLALAPGLLLFAWDRRPWEFKRLATSLAFMALGLSLYLYLPLRAAQGPLLDWGHPVSWRDFWFDFTRAQYGGGEGASWGSALAQGWALLKDDLWEWPGFLLAAFAGVWASWRRDRKEARGLAVAWLFWSVALGFFLHLAAERFYLLKDYTLAGEALVLVFVGFALRELPPVSRRFWVPALALFWAVLAVLRFATARQTDYTYAYDYTLNSFQEIPKGGLYFARGDSLVFPAWYFQWVEGRRPDLAVVGVDGLPMGWVRRTLARTHPDLHVPESDERLGLESTPSLMRWLVEKNKDRPLFLSFDPIDPGIVPGAVLSAQGLVERVDRSAGSVPAGDPDAPWARLRLRHWRDGSPVDGRTALFFANNYAWRRNALGLSAESEGDAWAARMKGPRAAEHFKKARAAYGRALDEYTRAAEWYPAEPKYDYNRGNALVKLGREEEALGAYAKAWTLDPRYAEAYFNGAIAAYHLGQYQRAGGYFQRVLDIDPRYPQAREDLDTLVGRGWYHP